MGRRDSRELLLNHKMREAGIGYAARGNEALDHFWVITLADPTGPVGGNWQREILRHVNQYRACNRLPSLSLNAALNIAAQRHSDDMATPDYFDHVTPQ